MDFPDAVDMNELVGADGRVVLSPVAGWDDNVMTGQGIRTGPHGDGTRGTATKEARANADLIASLPDLLMENIRLRRDLDEARKALEYLSVLHSSADAYRAIARKALSKLSVK